MENEDGAKSTEEDDVGASKETEASAVTPGMLVETRDQPDALRDVVNATPEGGRTSLSVAANGSGHGPLSNAAPADAAEGPLFPRTLEQRLAGDDFAWRGWQRLIDLADYFAHLVDGRTTGVLATESRETYLRVLGVATGLKATLQWFALDQSIRPEFIAEADRYLIDAPQDRWIEAPSLIPDDERLRVRSGPVVPRKGGRGSAGRLHALAELKRELLEILRPLNQKDLHAHLSAFHDAKRTTRQGWILARALGDQVLMALLRGTCGELLREQGFEWKWDENRSSVEQAINELLLDANIGVEPAGTRESRLEDLVERTIRAALAALGVRADRDLFRERRER